MAFDGVFASFLVSELNNKLKGKKISKVIAINENEYAFSFMNKESLLISANKNFPHFRMTDVKLNHTNNHFGQNLKRFFESSFIEEITQIRNDRVIVINVNKNDDLGYVNKYKLVFEFMGRNANIIITDENDKILEALHKHFDIDNRIIQNGAKYIPIESTKINPFTLEKEDKLLNENIYEGVSPLLFSEVCYNQKILKTITQEVNPTLFLGDKLRFYAFDLKHIKGERKHFDSLSLLLEYYVNSSFNSLAITSEQKQAKAYVLKEKEKAIVKLHKQEKELAVAKDTKLLELKASLLKQNIRLVKPYQKELIIPYNGENIVIELNTKISPTANIDYYYNKLKKQKRAIDAIFLTIENTKNEIEYYECLLKQIDASNTASIKEINKEIGITKKDDSPKKPAFIKYIDNDGNFIYVGKNNTQNNYLTNKLAKSTDYFFHVNGYPGCHVIYTGILTDEKIKLVASITAYHSLKDKADVAIDYTLIKNVKKVKGMNGSFVTYQNQKTTHASGDIDYINRYCHIVN